MAAPVVQASATNTGTGTSLAVSVPGTPDDTMILLALIAAEWETLTMAAAGWNNIHGYNKSGNNSYQSWWRKCTNSEPSSYTFNATGSVSMAAGLVLISGADTTSPIDDQDINATATGNQDNVDYPAVTTTGADRLLIGIAEGAGTRTTTEPTAYSGQEILDIQGTFAQLQVAWRNAATAGTYGPDNAVFSANVTQPRGATIAIKPAAGGGTTRGMPFGAESTAFAGGRCFKGPLC